MKPRFAMLNIVVNCLLVFLLTPSSFAYPQSFKNYCSRLLEVFHPDRHSPYPSVRYSGRVAIPAGVSFELTSLDGSQTTGQSTHRLSTLSSEYVRSILLKVKQLSVEGAPLGFREYGAHIFLYHDGRIESEMFTSNLPDRINSDNNSSILDNPKIIEDLRAGKISGLIDIHSHPGHEYIEVAGLSKNITMIISPQDFHSYSITEAFLAAVSPQPVKFFGVVVPVTKKAEDIFFMANKIPTNSDALRVFLAAERMGILSKIVAKINRRAGWSIKKTARPQASLQTRKFNI